MVLFVILSFVLIGQLWLRFDTLTARVGQANDYLSNQLRNYDELLVELQLLKRRVAMLEKPVPGAACRRDDSGDRTPNRSWTGRSSGRQTCHCRSNQ